MNLYRVWTGVVTNVTCGADAGREKRQQVDEVKTAVLVAPANVGFGNVMARPSVCGRKIR